MRILILAALLLTIAPIGAAELLWNAGFAAVKITPTQSMWLSGYGSRSKPSEGTESELYAKAAFIESKGGDTLILVMLDLVGLDRDTAKRITDAIQKKYNVPRQSIALCCSHTHCGPVVGTNLKTMYFLDNDEWKKVEDYTSALVGQVGEAVDAAAKAKVPVRLYGRMGECKFAVNRRENKEADVAKLQQVNRLNGPTDHRVPAISAKDGEGKLKGILYGYACHATTLNFQKWCADYPGFASELLEKEYPGAVAMFIAGCGADQNPLPRRSLDLAKKYGKMLAQSVVDAKGWEGNELFGPAKAQYREIVLPLARVPTRDELLKQADDKDKYKAALAKMLLNRLEKKETIADKLPYPVQSWNLGKGQFTLVLLGGEVVVDYSLRFQKDLGDRAWVGSYANDVLAYIPSARILKEGGYEGGGAMTYYGQPSPWAANVEELIVEEVRRQLK